MAYKIRIQSSGHEFTAENDETVLAAALRHGFPLAYSCRNGACGTCKGRIVTGRVDPGVYEDKALSAEERRAGKALLCQAVPQTDLVIEAKEVAAARDVVIKILPCRVARMIRLAHDVMELSLKLPQNERLQFLAGQYIDVLLRDGRRRSFSLANAPGRDELLQLHVRHVPGGHFSGHVFTTMKERDLLRFQGPLGTFFLRENDDAARAPTAGEQRPIIFVAGGTGFAPIKSILEHAFARGISRPMHLYWGARARRDLYLNELPEVWVGAHDNFRYTPVLSEPQNEDRWQGRSGWVHEAVLTDYRNLNAYEVYASGPPAMIDAVKQTFFARGLAEDCLFYDSFEYAHEAS